MRTSSGSGVCRTVESEETIIRKIQGLSHHSDEMGQSLLFEDHPLRFLRPKRINPGSGASV